MKMINGMRVDEIAILMDMKIVISMMKMNVMIMRIVSGRRKNIL